jgi:hypothetical protein
MVNAMTANPVQRTALVHMRDRLCVGCGDSTILTCLDGYCSNACCASCSDSSGRCPACSVAVLEVVEVEKPKPAVKRGFSLW